MGISPVGAEGTNLTSGASAAATGGSDGDAFKEKLAQLHAAGEKMAFSFGMDFVRSYQADLDEVMQEAEENDSS